MNGKRILLNATYLQLLAQALPAGEIQDASDFAKFLNNLKWKLKSQGKDEIFDQLIREEIHMFETKDSFI